MQNLEKLTEAMLDLKLVIAQLESIENRIEDCIPFDGKEEPYQWALFNVCDAIPYLKGTIESLEEVLRNAKEKE